MRAAYAHAIGTGYRFYFLRPTPACYFAPPDGSLPFTIAATDGKARTGVVLETARGPIRTPAFMPVGTAARSRR